MSYIGDEDVRRAAAARIRRRGRDEARGPRGSRSSRRSSGCCSATSCTATSRAYNVLVWDGEVTVIDFPQAVDPKKNRHARRSWSATSSASASGFERHGLHRPWERIADDLWTGWTFADLVPEELRGLTDVIVAAHPKRWGMPAASRRVMQAEGDIVRFPSARPRPRRTSRRSSRRSTRGLFKALYFVTGNRADAAELMQEAFLRLWERWDTIDGSTIPPPTSSAWRSTGSGCGRAPHAGPRGGWSRSTRRDPFDEVDMREDVRRMLLDLTPRQRAALVLLDHVRIRLRGGGTDHGHPSLHRASARHAGPSRAPNRWRPAWLS